MNEYIFDEHDELDSMLLCSEEKEYNLIEEECKKPIPTLEDYKEEKSLDCIDIPQDETEVSPIGTEAEITIDAEQELFFGDDEDNELIDIVGGL